MRTRLLPLIALVAAIGCNEAPLIEPGKPLPLNGPVSMAFLPGTNFAVIANANVNLTQPEGSLVAMDRSTRKILLNTLLSIPNFTGRILVDSPHKRIYVPDRGDNALLVFAYAIPGKGGAAVSFAPVNVPNPATDPTPLSNGIPTDENPFDVFLSPLDKGILFVTNALTGSVSVIPLSTLTALSLNPYDTKWKGLPLLSAANFKQQSSDPGHGANRIVPHTDGRLIFVTSSLTNDIYVVDTQDRRVEAVLDLSALASDPGPRAMVVTTDDLAYITHRSLGGVLTLDVSNVREDGNDFKVLTPRVVDFVPTGHWPEGIALTLDKKRLFVSNQGDSTVSLIDVRTRTVTSTTTLAGSVPGEVVVDPDRPVVYVLDFLSNGISVLDQSTGALLDTI